MTAGIYCIENLPNGKRYIGQSQNVEKRKEQHHHGSDAVYRAIKKYKKENFKRYVILYCEEYELNYYEIECIKIFHSHVSENGYNVSWGGSTPFKNRKHSRKTKQKMSKAAFGKHLSDETKQKISEARLGEKNPFFGKHHSNKTKGKMSKAQTGEKNHNFGKHPTLETIQKLSEAHSGERNPFFGKHHSKKTIQKISEAQSGQKNHNFGKHLTTKIKQEISKAEIGEKNHMFGKHHSDKAIRKMSEAHKGKYPTLETKKKMSDARRKYWENVRKFKEQNGK